VKCPTCGRPVVWSADFPERPFCSERCRLIDLGAWLSGDRAIPGEPVEDPSLLEPGRPEDGGDPGRGDPAGRERDAGERRR
jgi:endogenous inhibitor of DNA gyrase (YacG/DUF329 family)